MLMSMLSSRGPELDALAKQAEIATQRINGILRACLDYVDAELPLAKLAAVDLDSVFAQAERRLRDGEPRFAEAIVVRTGALPTVRGHAGWLLRIAQALLDNAARYAPPASRIELSARAEGERVRIEVADRGPGLTPQQCESVFDPFERLHAWDAVPGFGLSLATGRRALHRMGGELGLAPRAGGGLVAWFTLPRAEADLRPSS